MHARASSDPEQVNTLVDLYRRHQQRIYRYCLALLRNPDDAEDATQETFTRAAPFLPNLPGDLSAYLTTVARNICCDVVRARARRSVPIDNLPLADRKVSPERQSVDWDVVRRMWRQLSPSERTLFAYTFAGYKYDEIASRTGMSRPSVSVGLTRARRRLRDLATATGTLGLLPVAIRRLVERFGRRAHAAVSSAPASLLGVADQVSMLVVGLVSGLFVLSTAAPAVLPMVATAAHHHADAGADGASPSIASHALSAGTPAHLAASASPTGPVAPAQRGSSLPALPAGAAGLIPGSDATPMATGIDEMAASPNYPSDHTVLVAGPVVHDGCTGSAACPALFRTTDAGTTWTRLALLTYHDGPILLPPAYPLDPAVYMVVSNIGLEESPGGDGTFSRVIPGVIAAAVAPWSTTGHDELATITGGAVAIYAAGASAPTSTALLPPGFVPGSIAFVAPDAVAVGGWGKTSGAAGVGGAGAVTVCAVSGACAPAVTLAGTIAAAPALATSPNVANDHLLVAMCTTGVFVSHDGGQSFAPALQPAAGTTFKTLSVGQGPLGPRILVTTTHTPARPTISLLSSDDLGATFTDVTGNLGAMSNLVGTAAYADGTILAALTADAQNHFALRQGTGTGTWIIPS